ncbi:MAG: hypothetical protein IJ250_05370 [Bacteroidales bacterium]|nr:hypothetical protein [Bacteroidales bacterium]
MPDIHTDKIQDRYAAIVRPALQEPLTECSVTAYDDSQQHIDLRRFAPQMMKCFEKTPSNASEGGWIECNITALENLLSPGNLVHSSHAGCITVSKKVEAQQIVLLFQHYGLFLRQNIFVRLERMQIFRYYNPVQRKYVFVKNFAKGIDTLAQRKKSIKKTGFPCICNMGLRIHSNFVKTFCISKP